ncbi:PecA family PE domain-processing aspartic protease [Mycolicibacterium sp. Dal123E01]|uniref:PecA family PE domain-processing aspartic protease n=1 Tax=Mycolicibacterium sp. Dal123E01 TaxID=3457578 RepID=UPI00403E5354
MSTPNRKPVLGRATAGRATTKTTESEALSTPPAAAKSERDTAPQAADSAPKDDPVTPGYGDTSYLPGDVIIPGSAVKLALQQIAQTQGLLQAQTWGTGNVVSGVASVVPQMFLAEAAWALNTWQNSISGAQASVANTMGVPVAHELAQLSLLATLMLPTAAGLALNAANLTVPLVGVLGSPTAASQATGLIGQAKTNSMVYSAHLLRTVNTTQQIIYISVNGGPVIPVQLDTGSSGLTILAKYVGQKDLGPPVGTGTAGYGSQSGGVYYRYTEYETTVDFGSGATTSKFKIHVVDPEYEAAFDNYGTAGSGDVATLGIGANVGSGPTLNALLPGELKDGVMMYQNIIGSWGLVVFGPNPLPSKGKVDGGPVGNWMVKINDGQKYALKGNVDSGGVGGYLPFYVVPDDARVGTSLKPGTKVSVYTADGLTLLYTYTITAGTDTTSSNSPQLYSSDTDNTAAPNTGNIPWQKGPMYIDYGTPDRLGATYFDFF